ncbi:lysophospholipase [Gloeophyllum trabeum ATCC 11539]|uniref:Lysophospholipase n=1 Tax=Gloeophyllum trabeum (strain ATCC 11539 / FP-39264 / Madison 617) TaxID=670483 RepID=S7RQN2_GLOTA|nr:lysophospholipase [Gloeophyllum trabeum ATCC 11539]EPQ55214.1 lysophospholipase [Gloeophyllum trabeum ATCC 11539]
MTETHPQPFTDAYLPGPQSTKFYTRTYQPPSSSPPSAVVVFVHGFIDHVARYTDFHAALARSGLVVFAYDQRGFGRTALDEKGKERRDTGNRGYAKTSWREQLEDVEWMVKHAREQFGALPLFLMGHSMGGGLCIAFNTRTSAPPSASTVSLLSGVIACSPLLRQTTPASSVLKWVGGKASKVMPYMTIPAEVKAEQLSHNPAVVEAAKADSFVKYVGCLKGVSDMLEGGALLVTRDYKNWPVNLPLLIFHGTADEVTDPKASQEFIERVPAKDKTINLYPGAYHEPWHETVPEGVSDQMVREAAEWIKARSAEGEGSREDRAKL